MDPQKLSQLDPKLREAYQRVMGTPTSQPQTPPSQAQMPTPSDGQTSPTPTPTPAPMPTPAPEPKPIPPEPTPPIQEPPVPKSQPAVPQPEPPPEGRPSPEPAISPKPPVQASNFDQMNSAVPVAQTSPSATAPVSTPQAQTISQKKKNHLMPILIGLVFLVFIAVYTLFWTKIFNFKLPFLSF